MQFFLNKTPRTALVMIVAGSMASNARAGENQEAPTRESPPLNLIAETVESSRGHFPFSDENWISMGEMAGTDGEVSAAVADASGNVYIGGSFTVVHDVFAHHIARWDGSSWSALGSGMSGPVLALEILDGELYAGGSFTNAGGVAVNYIAKWDGSNWSSLGDGATGPVSALAVLGGDLYAGGSFMMAGGVSASRIAKWNGSDWSALGQGLSSTVWALAAWDGEVFAGGDFTTATNSGGETLTVNRIARWNGSDWSPLGGGLNSTIYGAVRSLTLSNGDLYVGGAFTWATNSGGVAVAVNRIAKWNGTSWSALGEGMDGSRTTVNALAMFENKLHAGGEFATADGLEVNHIARWDGSGWSALESGMGGTISVLAVSGGELYAGGFFRTAGDVAARRIASWDGNKWSALGKGMNSSVYALAGSGRDLYAGGTFTSAGDVSAHHVARWDGSNWFPLGGGTDHWVYALAVSGSDLYAGGIFSTAGGVAAGRVARWDGTNWWPLAGGVNGPVRALAVSGTDLYAGGTFSWATNSGGEAIRVNGIARWDGAKWSAMGFGVNHAVNAVAVWGEHLYVGGSFWMATNSNSAGIATGSIAKWDGSDWSALSSSPNFSVSTLAASDDDLYVGGAFSTVGGVAASRVARWNGTSWSALQGGVSAGVSALAIRGSDLYAAGYFTTVKIDGGDPLIVNHIAKWDGDTWSPLGSGMGSRVSALAIVGNDLYAGGEFATAGGKISGFMARAILPLPLAFERSSLTLTDGLFQLRLTGPENVAIIVDRSTDLTDWVPVATNILSPEGWVLSLPATFGREFYRARMDP